jgi:hypothetical protein
VFIHLSSIITAHFDSFATELIANLSSGTLLSPVPGANPIQQTSQSPDAPFPIQDDRLLISEDIRTLGPSFGYNHFRDIARSLEINEP